MKELVFWSTLTLVYISQVPYGSCSSTEPPVANTSSVTQGVTVPETTVTSEPETTTQVTTDLSTEEETTTVPDITTLSTEAPGPSLGDSCTNDTACIVNNSVCDSSICKCRTGYLQYNSDCLEVSALKLNISVTHVNESDISVSWDNPLNFDVLDYNASWQILSTLEKKYNITNMTTLSFKVDNPGEVVTLSITVRVNDSGGNMRIHTTYRNLTARPAMPVFNNSSGVLFPTNTPNISWTQRGFFDSFKGNISDKDGNEVYSFMTNKTYSKVKNLTPGMMYTLSLMALRKNMYGDIAYLNFSTSPTSPDRPTSVTLHQRGQRNFTLNVTNPQIVNGKLLGYGFQFEKRLYNDSTPVILYIFQNLSGSSLYEFTVDNLDGEFIVPGAQYTVRVFTTNEKFNSSAPTNLTFRTEEDVPGIVTNFTVSNLKTVVNVAKMNWNRPAMPNGEIVEYHLVIGNGSFCRVFQYCIHMCNFSVLNSCSNINILNLTLGKQLISADIPVSYETSYNVTVSAFTKIGEGNKSATAFTSVILAPGQPTAVRVTDHKTQEFTLSWSAPSVFPGPTIYTVTVVNDVGVPVAKNPSFTCTNISVTTCRITNLEEHWRYRYSVQAITSRNSSRVFENTVTTNAAAPGQVTELEVTQRSEDCTIFLVTWKDPSVKDRNARITKYRVTSVNGIMKELQASQLQGNEYNAESYTYSVQFTGLNDDINYPFVVAAISFDGTNGRAVRVNKQPDCSTSAGTIVAIILAFVVILGAALFVIFFCYRRQLKVIEARYQPQNAERGRMGFMPVNQDPVQEEIEQQRPFALSDAQKIFDEKSADANRLFSIEYEDLKKLSPKKRTEAANMEGELNFSGNKSKNRYVNILPFDHSRVTLSLIDDDRCSDYINANYIPGYTFEREFIASQGPLPGTVNDFWRMIWEKSVSIVIMLTKCREGNAEKCEHYWPDEVNEPKQYGDIIVNVISVSNMDKFDINIFHVTQGDYTRTVKHFQFLEWPDFSANVETGTIIDFVQTVRTHITPEMKGPVVAHCSAGVGRTGTYISTDYLLQFVRDHDLSAQVDIFDRVLKMRENRCSMVQVEKQYVFIHLALLDLIERKKKGLLQDDRDDEQYINKEVVYENTAFEDDAEEGKENGDPQTEL